MSRKQKFQKYDIVMAVDRGQIYEAKILKPMLLINKWKYFIHFQQWQRKFDVWIDENLLAKSGDIKAIDALILEYCSGDKPKADKKKKQKSNAISNEDVDEAPNSVEGETSKKLKKGGDIDDVLTLLEDDEIELGNIFGNKYIAPSKKVLESRANEAIKRRRMLCLSELVDEDDLDEKAAISITMPYILMKNLVDEWGLITTNNPPTDRKLLILPRKINIQTIIRQYLNEKKLSKTDDEVYEKTTDFILGLQNYFDRALPTILLYRQERKQYDMLVEKFPKTLPSKIYGCEHLLRLISKLPRLTSGMVMATVDSNFIVSKLAEFMRFLQKNSTLYLDILQYQLVDEALSSISCAIIETNEEVVNSSKKRSRSKKDMSDNFIY